MNLFGREIGAEEIAVLAFSLMALVIWVARLRSERAHARWFRDWATERKSERDASGGDQRPSSADPAPKSPRGP